MSSRTAPCPACGASSIKQRTHCDKPYCPWWQCLACHTYYRKEKR